MAEARANARSETELALPPYLRRRHPHDMHVQEYRERMDKLRSVLNTAAPPAVPKSYGLPEICFDEAGLLWRDLGLVEAVQFKSSSTVLPLRPYIVDRTESKMKLLGVALESAFQGMESTLTIPDGLNTMFNNDNFTVWQLTELRYDSGYDGVPVNFMCMMMACEGDFVLTQLVWKVGLAFVWAALKQQFNPDGLVPDEAYEDARKIAIERADLEEQLQRGCTVLERAQLLQKLKALEDSGAVA